ncbi:MAG: TatD family hydrolase [Myxococcota bacterium]|nr:TatD family hydrolase [Myxococcota bacterium]
MFDALSHLYTSTAPRAALEAGRAAGVHNVLLAGENEAGWSAQSALAGPSVHLAYGYHPWHTAGAIDAEILAAALPRLSEPVAIGEIGLDGSGRHRERLATQEAAFLAQLDLARQRDLPVVLHIVRAHGAALACVDRCQAPPGIVHGFSGSSEVAEEWLRRGFLLSFGHLVCNKQAKRARIAASQVPLERLLVESDSPGGFESPAGINQVLASLSSLRSEPVAVLMRETAANARRLLRLQP